MDEAQAGRGRHRTVIRVANLALWAAVLAFQAAYTIARPGILNFIVLGAFVLLFLAVNVQLFLLGWLAKRRWTRAAARLHGSTYLSDLENLPNRNYLLSELRREMPRARDLGRPFCLVILSLDTLEEVRRRRGDDFAERATRGLAMVVKRFTRTSDFVAHLDGARFCVLLVECRYQDSFVYLERVPGTFAVSDGHRMYEVPVAARVAEYDLESLYATDVLREAEEAKPLRRRKELRPNSEVA